MNIDDDIEIFETIEHGSVLVCRNLETADQFEDFLAEHCFVLFNISLDSDKASFFFGQASSVEKIHDLYERFKSLESNSLVKRGRRD